MAETLSHAEWIRDALKRFEAPLIRYATRLCGDGDRARDVVQETFLNLCQARRSTVDDHLRAWLFRVCRNRMLDMRRKERRMQPLKLVEEKDLASMAPSPAVIAEARDQASKVVQIIDSLSESHKETVYLRFQSNLTYKEIAEVTGHSVSNVGVIIHTAVNKIREQMRVPQVASKKAASNKAASKKTASKKAASKKAGGAR